MTGTGGEQRAGLGEAQVARRAIDEEHAERRFARLVHFDELPRGGHFAAMEQSSLSVDALRATFARLRP